MLGYGRKSKSKLKFFFFFFTLLPSAPTRNDSSQKIGKPINLSLWEQENQRSQT